MYEIMLSDTSIDKKTRASFNYQWSEMPTGDLLLNDPWFEKSVDVILSEQELCIQRNWFHGKKILDVGCGNGRWTYGFLKLGAKVTSVDASAGACDYVRQNIGKKYPELRIFNATVQHLPADIKNDQFDLVFSWGVLHHIRDTKAAMAEILSLLKPDGVFYTYLYGKKSIRPGVGAAKLFLLRRFLSFFSPAGKHRILKFLYRDNSSQLHAGYDLYATPLNHRYTFEEVKKWLEQFGFSDVVQTIRHTELFIRATRGNSSAKPFLLPLHSPPYWFEHINPANEKRSDV